MLRVVQNISEFTKISQPIRLESPSTTPRGYLRRGLCIGGACSQGNQGPDEMGMAEETWQWAMGLQFHGESGDESI